MIISNEATYLGNLCTFLVDGDAADKFNIKLTVKSLTVISSSTYIVPVIKFIAFLLQTGFQLPEKSLLVLLGDEARPHFHL